MAKFCSQCGTTMNDDDKHCPNCGTSASLPKQQMTLQSQKPIVKPRKKISKLLILKVVAILLAIVIGLGIGICTLAYFEVVNVPYISDSMKTIFKKKANVKETGTEKEEQEEEETGASVDYDENEEVVEGPFTTKPLDAEKYLKENAEILSVEEAQSSATMQSESDVYNFLKERGFVQCTITANYTIEGSYYDSKQISAYSSEKHPIYSAQYVTESGNIWILTVTNGVIVANPVFYNLQETTDKQLVLAETDFMFSYDSATNKFFKIVPNGTRTALKQITRIDAQTLEGLTKEGVGSL